MQVFVIHERYGNHDTIIGVADSVEKADLMIEEYYGSENYQEVDSNHVGESVIECVKKIEVRSARGVPYNVTITLLYFTVNSL